MGVKVLVERIKLPDDRYIAWFKAELSDDIDVEKLPSISLARVPDHCFYRVDKLQEHNFHAPPYNSKEEVNEYIKRVVKDISVALEPLGIKMAKAGIEDANGLFAKPIQLPPGGTISDN